MLLLLHLIWLTGLQMLGRWAQVETFIAPDVTIAKADLWRMWLTGLRFDLRIAAIVIAPLWVFALLGLFFNVINKNLVKIAPAFLYSTAFIVAAITIANYFYYQTFHNHIDIFAFGLFEDDTKAVLENAWQDYPILTCMIAAGCLGLPTAILSAKAFSSSVSIIKKVSLSYAITLIGLTAVIVIAARGSVGTFPLRRSNAQVSNIAELNKFTPNGLMAIDWAIKDRKADARFEPVTQAEGCALSEKLGFTSLYGKTEKNDWLENNPPHVVMTVLESFGSNFLAFDDEKTNDLLGALRPHIANDFYFTRFLPAGNGTAPSLAGLFFHSPVESISHSSVQNKSLAETPFATYKKAGYDVIFISSGNMMWRNLANYLPKQGVDRVYDQNSLLDRYPEAQQELTAWGVPDEYAYRLAQDLLAKADKPTFISLLSVTNHPPYVVPKTYQAKPVSITAAVKRHAELPDHETLNMLRTFQYAANAFGEFVSTIKASPLGDKTLIAATGDHQMRRVKPYYPQELFIDKAVPLYLYVPEKIKQNNLFAYHPERIGSHKDIFPTLYSVSLSEREYLALGGRNLLAERDDETRAFGYNDAIIIDQFGAYINQAPFNHFIWRGDNPWLLSGTATVVADTKNREYYQHLLRWNISNMVHN
ncbi:MAG: LTA synthase family protein [Cetobacterium sp.]